jgi:ABC-type uncharacterized transport system YnjBCD permease subunit
VVIGFFGALAFARYNWLGRRTFQKVVLLPIFFPQPVLGLALLLWFNAVGIPLSWQTAVVAHLVWIVPVVTLVIATQVYSFDPTLEEAAFDLGASRWQVMREGDAADPVAGHLVRRAVRLPAVVGQLPAVALHDGRRLDGAGVALREDGGRLHSDGADARHHEPHRRGAGADCSAGSR